MDGLWQDVKYGVRSLRRTPVFIAAAILTLALGMGANTTIFTLLDAVLFKPLPVPQPDELLTVHEHSPDAAPNALPETAGGTGRYLRFSYPRFRLLQQALGANGSLAASTLSARFVGRTAIRAVSAGRRNGIISNQRVSTSVAMTGMRPLVAAQLALSFAVIFAAVLLGRTLSYFARLDPGFNPGRLITAAIDPDTSGFRRDQIPALVDRVIAEVDAVPGVVSTSVTTCALMTNCTYSGGFAIEGTDRGGIQVNSNWVSPKYFSTVGIPLLSGRDFTDRDAAQSPRVAIVSESIARRYFANISPLGKRLGYQELDTEIVGVVRDVRLTLHSEPNAMIYFPTRQPPNFTASPHGVAVRVAGDAGLAVPAIRSAIQRAAPSLLIDGVTPMSVAVQRDVARERLVAYLAASFAFVALLLACIGLYGVLSYTVTRRTQEIGVRMALGARPADLTRMVIGDGSRMVLSGVAVGILAALIVGRLVTTLLAGVAGSDPIAMVTVAVALVVVALAASYLPARRASRIDPATALRTE